MTNFYNNTTSIVNRKSKIVNILNIMKNITFANSSGNRKSIVNYPLSILLIAFCLFLGGTVLAQTTICEDFNNTTGTGSYNTGGTLPAGWHRIYGGTSATGGTVYDHTATSPANMAHVCTTSATTPGAPNSSNYVCFHGNSSNSYSYAIMPAGASGRAASHISFTYKFESASYGTLTYGAISGTDASTYTVLGTVSSPSSNPGTVDVDLDVSQTYNKRIAFRWYKDGTWYTCGIDDICVDYVNVYSLAFSASPSAGGSVSVTTNGNNATSGGHYGAGTTFNITATPATGYVFTGWTVTGSAPASSTSASTTLNLTSNTTLTANFIVAPRYDITVSADPTAGGSVSGGGNCAQGSSCTVSATAATHSQSRELALSWPNL